MTREESLKILDDYSHKSKVLKQIHSDKKYKFEKWSHYITIISIVSSILLAFIGFTNKEFLIKLFWSEPTSESVAYYDLLYNTVILIFLIVSVLSLIFRYHEKANECNRAVVILSGLTRNIKLLKVESGEISDEALRIETLRIISKYDGLVDLLPPNTDKEFLKAKRSLLIKSAK